MKFSSVSFSEDSSPKLYQMCGQILTFPEKRVRLDTQHGDHIQQNQLHVNALGDHHKSIQPDLKKKTLFTLAPLNHMHKGHCSYLTILKMAAVSSTIILPLPQNQLFDQTTSTNTTELAASANTVNRTVSSSTTDGTAKTPLKVVEQNQLMTRSQKYLRTIEMHNEWQVVSKEKKNISNTNTKEQRGRDTARC